MTRKYSYPCVIEELPAYYRNFLRELVEAQMTLYASQIYNVLEMETEQQFAQALERAIQTMHKAGIPVEHHIQPVYAGYGDELIVDYKMTPLAFGLLTMNMYPDTAVSARLKAVWAKKLTEL